VPFAATLRPASIALAYLCGAGCAVLVACLLLDARFAAGIAKVLASAAFVGVAVSSGAMASRFGRILLAGLLLSWFGDVFLIGQTRSWFIAGLSSFLLAHFAYIGAFFTLGVDRRWTLGAALPVGVLAAGVLLWLSPYLPAPLLWPVGAYTAAISVMVITAFGTLGAGASPLIVSGACLFYLSDLSVAATRFTEPSFPTFVLGLPLYYIAQVCLALSTAAPWADASRYATNSRDPSTAGRRNSPPGNR